MKYIILLISCLFILNSCKNKENTQEKPIKVAETAYISFGDTIVADGAINSKTLASQYKSLKVGDSMNTKITATVKKVCQNKGCWLTLDLGNDAEEVMVKFKDYAIFMPKDIAGKEVVLNGKAYITEVPVDEQRHYAEDEGKTKEEIESITEPKITLSFEADGVLLKQ